jgi:hypothetical protein
MREAARRKMWKLLSMMRLDCLLLTLNDWPNTKMMEKAKRRREGKMPVGDSDESCPDKEGEEE